MEMMIAHYTLLGEWVADSAIWDNEVLFFVKFRLILF